jgi:hypothetical protein
VTEFGDKNSAGMLQQAHALIDLAFTWSTTTEGHDYWSKVSDRIWDLCCEAENQGCTTYTSLSGITRSCLDDDEVRVRRN